MQTGTIVSVLVAQGESSFVALQLYYAFTIMRYFAEKKNDTEYIAYLDKTQKEIGDKINDLWWEDDRYNRGFKDTGELIGFQERSGSKYVAQSTDLGSYLRSCFQRAG